VAKTLFKNFNILPYISKDEETRNQTHWQQGMIEFDPAPEIEMEERYDTTIIVECT